MRVVTACCMCGPNGCNVLLYINDNVPLFPCVAAEISARFDHPGPAADATQPEELSGARPDGAMVRMKKKHPVLTSYLGFSSGKA